MTAFAVPHGASEQSQRAAVGWTPIREVLYERLCEWPMTTPEAIEYLKANGFPDAYHGPVSGAISTLKKAGLVEQDTIHGVPRKVGNFAVWRGIRD